VALFNIIFTMFRLWPLLLSVFCVGCASGAGAVYDAMRASLSTGTDLNSTPAPRPDMQYLQVMRGGQASRLALGYLEPEVQSSDGPVQVWFSANGNLLKLQNGRVVGSAGLGTNWQAVRWSSLPAWDSVPAQGITFERERDVMPGYRYGVRDLLELRPIDALPSGLNLPQSPWRIDGVRWFVETELNGQLPPSYFAVDPSRADQPVVFSRQCLSVDLCLSMYPLPSGSDKAP
jgi:hypothetical protein